LVGPALIRRHTTLRSPCSFVWASWLAWLDVLVLPLGLDERQKPGRLLHIATYPAAISVPGIPPANAKTPANCPFLAEMTSPSGGKW
jgi:hypothetical protein